MITCHLEDDIQNLLLIALEEGADVKELHAIVDHARNFHQQTLRETEGEITND